jgi:hypothetical protein
LEIGIFLEHGERADEWVMLRIQSDIHHVRKRMQDELAITISGAKLIIKSAKADGPPRWPIGALMATFMAGRDYAEEQPDDA